MRLMFRSFPALALLLASVIASHAQTSRQLLDEVRTPEMKEYLDARARQERVYVGMPLPPFAATTGEGRRMTAASMLGDVYLLLMFYPDCRCVDPKDIAPVFALEATHMNFHVVAMLQDTAYLYVYRQDHPEPLHFAVTDTREQSLALRLGNGAPAMVLVDRKGLVVKIFAGSDMLALSKFEDERAELGKTVAEVLRR